MPHCPELGLLLAAGNGESGCHLCSALPHHPLAPAHLVPESWEVLWLPQQAGTGSLTLHQALPSQWVSVPKAQSDLGKDKGLLSPVPGSSSIASGQAAPPPGPTKWLQIGG